MIILSRAICVCLMLLSFSAVSAPVIMPAPPQLSAKAYLLIDADTGKVIVEHNADMSVEPASLTKMMTAYIVSEEIIAGRLREDELVKISDDAWKRGGTKSGSSTMFLKPRSEVKVIDLLRGIIIQSGNDASIAMAQHIAGGEDAFADVMNQQAALLGMKNTTFLNSTGWPAEGHLTTARDLAILARAVINDHPQHYSIHAEKYFKFNGINQGNRNKLLFDDPNVDGLKTGHTESAGYCLVASSKRNNMRLVSVVLGTNSDAARTKDSQKLLSYGFRYYNTQTLYKKGAQVTSTRVWKGVSQMLALTVAEDIVVTIPRGAEKQVKALSKINYPIEAPIQKSQVLGDLVLKLDDKTLGEFKLIAAAEVNEAGFFSRIKDSVLMMFDDEPAAP